MSVLQYISYRNIKKEVANMDALYKKGSKILFIVACVIFALSLAFSGYSYATYVSGVDSSGNSSGVATIACTYSVDNGGQGSFVNAPYIFKITDTTQPVRLNHWAESVITVRNNGKAGLNYEYSFVFYMPTGFAQAAMFQFAELTDGNYVYGDRNKIVKASKMYRIAETPDGGSVMTVEETAETSGGIAIENEFQDIIDKGGLLGIDEVTSYAVEQEKQQTGTVRHTYATYSGVGSQETFVGSVTFADEITYGQTRVTFNIKRSAENRYVLKNGDAHSFLFRLVLRDELNDGEFSSVWNADNYWEKDEHGNYTEAKQTPTATEDFKYRWIKGDTPTAVPRLQYANAVGGDNWETVTVKDCIGITSPCKINMVFTQTA